MEKLTKIHIPLPNHWATGGESLWALPLGNNNYQIKNIPFYAYGLNYDDIVEALPPDTNSKPIIKKLLKQNGHITIRVIFLGDIVKQDAINMMDEITADKGSGYEGISTKYFAIDIEPDGNYDSILDKLDKLESKEIISYETCEQRIENSFDSEPEEAGG